MRHLPFVWKGQGAGKDVSRQCLGEHKLASGLVPDPGERCDESQLGASLRDAVEFLTKESAAY